MFASLATDLAVGFDGADRLCGFAHHEVDTLWLGSSSGLRRRFVQRTGSVEINGKRRTGSAGNTEASAWAGAGTRDFTDVSTVAAGRAGPTPGLGGTRFDLPAGRYETLMPPSTVADLMIYLAWTMEGRGAEEGRTALRGRAGTGSASGSPTLR